MLLERVDSQMFLPIGDEATCFLSASVSHSRWGRRKHRWTCCRRHSRMPRISAPLVSSRTAGTRAAPRCGSTRVFQTHVHSEDMHIQTWAWKSSFVPEFDDTAFRLITDKTRQLASRMIMSVTDPIRVVAKKLRGSPPSNSIYQRQILLPVLRRDSGDRPEGRGAALDLLVFRARRSAVGARKAADGELSSRKRSRTP